VAASLLNEAPGEKKRLFGTQVQPGHLDGALAAVSKNLAIGEDKKVGDIGIERKSGEWAQGNGI
jgi:hypothetical protein